ncbi:MAG: DUF4252 domain-containing protein [Paludibacteraceae bacterium]|nr:DUF4252 domain-containing protein [Paludibacteraceae bacterium]
MKKILLVAVITLWSFAAQAQNKIFEKYAKMEGVEYVCINKAMFSAGLSIATAGQVVVDETSTQGTDLSKFANYNRMLIITAKGDKKQQLYDDIQKLAKETDYEVLMQSHSADGNDATFLHNEKANPNEFIICNIREEDCSVVVLLKDK